MNRYHCESDMRSADIRAALRDGTLTAWRTDAFGRRWFKSCPMIRGVKGSDEHRGSGVVALDSLSDADQVELDEIGTVFVGDDLYKNWRTDSTGRQWLRRIAAQYDDEQEESDDEIYSDSEEDDEDDGELESFDDEAGDDA